MDVVVKSRHCSVAEEFRLLVEEKLARLEKLDDRVIRVEVEVTEEPNKRQHDQAHCVEITLRSKGPVVRAEAASTDKVAAFDMALDRVMAQLRKAADRKKVHRGQHAPQSLRVATPPDLGGGARRRDARPRATPVWWPAWRCRATGRSWCGRRRTPPAP